MIERRLLFAAALLPLIALPARAQTTSAGAFVGTAPGAAEGTRMVGLSAALHAGPVGLRVAGAMDAAGTPAGFLAPDDARDSGAWSADADVEFGARRSGPGWLPLRPTAFGGVGLRRVNYRAAFDAAVQSKTVPVYSYGARLALPLAGWLALEGEARRRTAFEQDWRPVVDGWEFRAGVALRFGGGNTSASAAPARPGRRSATTRIAYGGARSDASAAEIADGAIRLGERYIGTSYAWGGESPRTGFDCSGFVQYVFGQQGIALPRVSRQQAHAGLPLTPSLSGLARGDLMFFAGDDGRIDHVAIYAGDGRILHSTSSGGGVRYDDLSSSRGRWFRTHLVAARRVIAPGGDPATPSPTLPLDEAFDTVAAYDRGDDAPKP